MPTKLKKMTAAPVVKSTAKRVVRVPAPAETKAALDPAKAVVVKADKAKTPRATRNISKDEFLGRSMRISEFQDYTLSINAKARLTDEALCTLWQEQFPRAVTFTVHHVRGVRRDYNKGIHSKAFAGKKVGDAISVSYTPGVSAAPAAPAKPAKVAKSKAA